MHIHGYQKIWAIPIPKFRPFVYFLFLKRGFIIYLGALKRGGGRLFGTQIRTMSYMVPPPRFITIYGAGSIVKKIDLYNIHVHNPEGCCFMVFPDLVRSV